MQFSNPMFLWTLAGLSIPIGIHLLSRKEGKVIRLGSLRHLQETSTQQFRGIRLNEVLLLTLRCLLIMLFSLLLSGLHWDSSGEKRWVLIEKGLESQSHLISMLDSLNEEGYESRWLADGFPLLRDSASVTTPKNYWQIIEQIKLDNRSEIVVFAQNNASNFKGTRKSLPPNIRWTSLPRKALDYPLQVIQVSKDSLSVRTGHTNESETYFTNEKAAKQQSVIESVPMKTITINLISDKNHIYDQKIMKAVLEAISKSFPINLTIEESIRNKSASVKTANWIIWLSDSEIPTTFSKLIYLKSQLSNSLINLVKPNQWIITKRLTEEVALKENLTLAVAAILLPQRKLLEEKAALNDRRMIPDSIAWSDQKTNIQSSIAGVASESANPYLLLLFFIVLFTERIIAYNRNQ